MTFLSAPRDCTSFKTFKTPAVFLFSCELSRVSPRLHHRIDTLAPCMPSHPNVCFPKDRVEKNCQIPQTQCCAGFGRSVVEPFGYAHTGTHIRPECRGQRVFDSRPSGRQKSFSCPEGESGGEGEGKEMTEQQEVEGWRLYHVQLREEEWQWPGAMLEMLDVGYSISVRFYIIIIMGFFLMPRVCCNLYHGVFPPHPQNSSLLL